MEKKYLKKKKKKGNSLETNVTSLEGRTKNTDLEALVWVLGDTDDMEC